MRRLIVRAEDFANLFNAKVLGAYRRVTADDIRLLTQFGLIGRYGFYDTRDDLQTIIGILNYERLREKKTQEEKLEAIGDPSPCRLCGKPLSSQPEGKRGRPREYCLQCEASRVTERNRKWRKKMKAARN